MCRCFRRFCACVRATRMLRALAYVPMALILVSIFFTAVPLSMDSETLSYYLPITVGSLISIAIGEVLIAARARRRP